MKNMKAWCLASMLLVSFSGYGFAEEICHVLNMEGLLSGSEYYKNCLQLAGNAHWISDPGYDYGPFEKNGHYCVAGGGEMYILAKICRKDLDTGEWDNCPIDYSLSPVTGRNYSDCFDYGFVREVSVGDGPENTNPDTHQVNNDQPVDDCDATCMIQRNYDDECRNNNNTPYSEWELFRMYNNCYADSGLIFCSNGFFQVDDRNCIIPGIAG